MPSAGGLFAVILAAALPLGPATAVATAFWSLTATSGLALAAAVVLGRTERRVGHTSHAAARG